MQQKITLTTSDHHQLDAYEYKPANPSYGLIVLQEIFGVNQHIRKVCSNFARNNFHVIAPALFDRIEKNIELSYETANVKKGINFRARINPEETLLDIIATAHHLPYKQIGIIGYCWGGSLSWRAATETHLFAAASCWYGAMIPSLLQNKPNCPVQMHFGEKDQSIPLSEINKIKTAYPEVDIYVYKDADHGFGCAERASFHSQSYELAQKRTLEFFKSNL